MTAYRKPLSCTAGEGAERGEAGEGVAAKRPSPTARCRERVPLSRSTGEGKAIACFVLILACTAARAEGPAAIYRAYWAGLPAGEIRRALGDAPGAYQDRIEIRSLGLRSLVTRFRGSAVSEGRLAAGRLPLPARFDAAYDLRKRRDRRL